jgi:LacI family transcriptional regulator
MTKTKIYDIAKRANVSSMTVSRVLNNSGPVAPETKKLINKIIKELNYQPNLIARSLSQKKTMTIGVVIPKKTKMFLDAYSAEVLSGITDKAHENHYRIMLFPRDDTFNKKGGYLALANSNIVDGIVLVTNRIDDPYMPELMESEFPFAVVNYNDHSKKLNFVDCKNIEGAMLAVNYLYKKGHRKIAHIVGDLNETNGIDRFNGYKKALKKLKLPIIDEYIVYGKFEKEIAYKEVDKLLNLKNRPTAIFCADDSMAFGVLEKLKERKLKVPKDIAIIGFDNTEIAAYQNPSLTTVKQPIYEIGTTSIDILLKLISKKTKPPIRKMLNTELVIRESA